MPPVGETLLDVLTAHGHQVMAIGKINDLFAGRGIGQAWSDDERRPMAMDVLSDRLSKQDAGLIFANLVDFDTLYGHRNDVGGLCRATSSGSMRGSQRCCPCCVSDDLLVITADHGNDPTTPSTDHSREHVPVLVGGPRVRAGVSLGTRSTFADLGQTLAEVFGVPAAAHGTSFPVLFG